MNIKSALALLAAGAFMVACSDEVVNINDEAKDKATITIKVMDNHDGSAIAEASVYSVVDDETEVTDEFGLAVWKKQVLGDHYFQISKDGYATILANVPLAEQGQGNVARVGDVVQPVYMYKNGVNAKGTVLYTDEKGNSNAASGVTVYASLPANFVPSELTAETDKNGEYSFKDLPEGVQIAISVGQATIDKKSYTLSGGAKVIDDTYRAGDAVNVDIVRMKQVAAQLVPVSNNLDKIDTSTAVTLNFSTTLVADSLKSKWLVVYNSDGDKVMVTLALTSDKKGVTIKPASGKWLKGKRYYIEGYVFSTDGVKIENEIDEDFVVSAGKSGNAPAALAGQKATVTESDYYGLVTEITWTAPSSVKDIAAYQVWYKTKNTGAFVFYDDYSIGSSAVEGAKLTIYLNISDADVGDEIEIAVLPVNASGDAAAFDKTTPAKTKIRAAETI